MSIRHNVTSTKQNNPDVEVSSDAWNASHIIDDGALTLAKISDHTKAAHDALGIGGSIPTGLICMWSGLISNIPAGWYLCDGDNGTPNLTDKFIKATTSDPGGTGGSSTLTHSGVSVQDHPAQDHTKITSTKHWDEQAGDSSYDAHPALAHVITQPSDHTNVEPVYYTLAFIMKS